MPQIVNLWRSLSPFWQRALIVFAGAAAGVLQDALADSSHFEFKSWHDAAALISKAATAGFVALVTFVMHPPGVGNNQPPAAQSAPAEKERAA